MTRDHFGESGGIALFLSPLLRYWSTFSGRNCLIPVSQARSCYEELTFAAQSSQFQVARAGPSPHLRVKRLRSRDVRLDEVHGLIAERGCFIHTEAAASQPQLPSPWLA